MSSFRIIVSPDTSGTGDARKRDDDNPDNYFNRDINVYHLFYL